MCKTSFEQGSYTTGSAARRTTTFRLIRALLWLAVASGPLFCEAVRAAPESPSLDEYVYPGDDLGAVYSPQATTLKVWAPTAKNASVVLFADARGQDSASIPMSRDPEGIWSATLEGDQDGKYYLLEMTHQEAGADKATVYRVNDPYARNNGDSHPLEIIGDCHQYPPVSPLIRANQRNLRQRISLTCEPAGAIIVPVLLRRQPGSRLVLQNPERCWKTIDSRGMFDMAETGARRGMRDPVVPGSGLSVHTYHLTDYPPAADMEGVWMPAIGERSSDCEIVQQWDWSPEGSVLGSNCHGCYTEIRGRRHGTDVVLVLPLAEGAFSQGL